MTWRFRKLFRKGIFQTSITRNGLGLSVSLLGLCRIGVSPRGQYFLSFGIPRTGFYWIHYFGKLRKLPKPSAPQHAIFFQSGEKWQLM